MALKKYRVGFALLSIALTAVLGVFGFQMLDWAYGRERAEVENLAGAIVEEFPEAEESFASAINGLEKSNQEEGRKILSKYGHDGHRALLEDSGYRKAAASYFAVLLAFQAALLAMGYFFSVALEKRKRQQEDGLLEFLDQCLAGRYGFTEDEEQLGYLHNPLLSHMLRMFGSSLQLKEERLDQERESIKMLVTDISHQLKTPLSALETCFSMYLEADCEAEREEFLDRCQGQIGKLKALIASLTNISRLESNLISLSPEPVSLAEVVLGAVNAVYCKALEKGIEISMNEFADMALQLDQKWTVEALANILDNGIKYSPAGSCIYIRVQRQYSFVRIEVEDQGIGVSKEEQNKIFQRFYRGGSSLVKSTEGSGVGLYLSRMILESQGGTVSVRSSAMSGKAQGSVFAIHLPLEGIHGKPGK